ncbi:MAG: thiamine pyrophosphate-binding protein, partial [Firmicutes bacterium]|nr:thiamine pyrophosphate-binding protein [Bacillota bacterium]
HEVETAVRLGLGVVFCVLNDQELALIKLKQEKHSYHAVGTDFSGADYAAIGRAMGAEGARVESLADLRAALADALRRGGPTVLDIRINPAEYRRQM